MKVRNRFALILLAVTAGCRLPAPWPDCPSIDAFLEYRPPEATRVFARDSSRLADLAPERRTVVSLNDVPVVLRDGIVAVEDRRFHSHRGIDPRGVVRATWRNLRSRSFAEGFSTITMQLARNVFTEELPRSKTLRRKFCEVQLAPKIERALGKDQILERYLNQVYMGDGLYGVEEASRVYFGKSVDQIAPVEAAMLIGLVQSPGRFHPRHQPERARMRRNVVLGVLVREKVLSKQEAEQAREDPLTLADPLEAAGPAPYVIAAVREELRERFGPDAHVRGLRVYTGLDPVIQAAANDALVAQIRRVESGAFGTYNHPVAPEGALAPASGGGSPYLQGMAVVLDATTGEVRALVGGRDFRHSSYDRALLARRQPGSAFKPFVYAAAIEAGLAVNQLIETGPIAVSTAGTPVWTPDDLVPDATTMLSVPEAMARSSNHAAIRVGQLAGVGHVASLARRTGIESPIPAVPSIFLGAAEVVPAELVAAFATFGNGGLRVRPHLIRRVEDANGNLLWEPLHARERALEAGVAFITLDLMRGVVNGGTGHAVRTAGFHAAAAGKTGTTNDAKDVWFVGMNRELVAGVWLGFDQPVTILPNATGGRLAAPVWGEIMSRTYADRPAPGDWQPPSSVTALSIDVVTGGIADINCPADQVRTEYFLAGTEPHDFCPLHRRGSLRRILDSILRGIGKTF